MVVNMASCIVQQVEEVKLSVSINGQQIKGSPYSIMVQQHIAKDCTRVSKCSKKVNSGGKMGEPWGIAFGKNGMWAVADNTKCYVYIFDEQDQDDWQL